MSSPDRRTRTADDAPPAPTGARHAYLVLALACDRPTTPPARWVLENDVLLSGAAPAATTRDAGTLAIACDDAWASTRHAAIRRSFGRWMIEDLGSKNGTFVGGERIARRQLDDGDLIEIGHTLYRFCEPLADLAPGDRTINLGAEFLTLHAPLEQALARAVAAVIAGLPVLVEGETGVGKERFVAAIHAASARPGALVAVNCAALPAALVEDELFGHRRGAFSGAIDERTGYIRAAHTGTLFLDEVGDMPAAAQAALLRVLAERTVTPVGDERAIAVDVAVISATNRDPRAMTAAGAFRADLLARLCGFAVQIAGVRDRREDIGIFIARTLARVAPDATMGVEAARRLLAAPWLLNVRELEHVVAAAALRARGRPIAATDLEGAPAPLDTPVAEKELSPEDAALRDRLVAALAAHAGNISAVARELGRDRKQIHRWIERLAIDPASRGK